MVMIPLPENREEWLRLRSGYVGGSESAALMGPEFSAGYQKSAYALHLIKSGQIEDLFVDNADTRMGLRLERTIAEMVCEQEGWTLHPGMYAIDDETDRMAASLDFIVTPKPEDAERGLIGDGVLQIKKVRSSAYYQKWDGDEAPAWILIQVQHEIACSGLRWGAVGALVGDGVKLSVTPYQRHEPMIAMIRKAVENFWKGVDERVPPEVDGKESTKEALRKLFGEPAGNENLPVDLSQDNELPDLCASEKRLRAEIKAAQANLDTVTNRIRFKLGDSAYATVGGFRLKRSIGDDTPDRPALPGEIIKGRRGADRLTVTALEGRKSGRSGRVSPSSFAVRHSAG